MSCRGRVSVGIRGSEVSWWVKQCSDLPRRRRTPREALSFKCAQRDPHPSLNGCSAAVWTVGPFFFSAVGGMCFICQSRNTPGQPLSEACSSKIRAHTHIIHTSCEWTINRLKVCGRHTYAKQIQNKFAHANRHECERSLSPSVCVCLCLKLKEAEK